MLWILESFRHAFWACSDWRGTKEICHLRVLTYHLTSTSSKKLPETWSELGNNTQDIHSRAYIRQDQQEKMMIETRSWILKSRNGFFCTPVSQLFLSPCCSHIVHLVFQFFSRFSQQQNRVTVYVVVWL